MDTTEAVAPVPQQGPSAAVPISVNKIWTKVIPVTNTVFLVLNLVLVFGLDLVIIIQDPSLRGFWYIMLGVLAVFFVFYCLEKLWLSKMFASGKSALDGVLVGFVFLRNIIFLLNFIPLIQLLGLVILWTGGLVLLFVYVILIFLRRGKRPIFSPPAAA